ncbi:MAG: septum formation protein Maf [Paludibacteraceae bacterium]|nr:septum formation protein Maf [Paludibacteraceae bacterium]
MEIILGSQSPRRRELMAGLDLPFTAISIDADESYPADLKAGEIPYFISRAKANAYAPNLQDNQLLITADTIVWLEGQMLGKPHDEQDAINMLKRLRNKTHQVYTAVTFAKKSQESLFLETVVDRTDVTFGDLTDEEIAYYVQKYRPMDKAGAYGVQEWIGYVACTQMRGSYFNVMGFPVHKVYEMLKKWNIF